MLSENEVRDYAREVASTIKKQIFASDYFAFARWGAKDFTFQVGYKLDEATKSDKHPALLFKVGGLAKFKGYITIAYNVGTDSYDIFAWQLRKYEIKVKHRKFDVYFDDLVGVLDEIIK